MKTFTVATIACAALLSATSVDAMQSFLAKIPNGSLFGKWLGHTTDDYTTFGNDFSASFEWTEHLCGLNSLTSTMTNGEALGDPCCTWKSGATPMTITAWKEGAQPTVKTECASKGGSGSTTPTVTTKAPAAATTAPAATTTTAPAATKTTAPAATKTTAPSTAPTTAPTTTKTKKPSSKTPKPSKASKTPKPTKASKTPSNKCTKKPKRF